MNNFVITDYQIYEDEHNNVKVMFRLDPNLDPMDFLTSLELFRERMNRADFKSFIRNKEYHREYD